MYPLNEETVLTFKQNAGLIAAKYQKRNRYQKQQRSYNLPTFSFREILNFDNMKFLSRKRSVKGSVKVE